ncbi:hypothetical protein L7F22_050385 [Adiantum nelumboides]|nr:hypothetical protein [Adiantum nelumboides]
MKPMEMKDKQEYKEKNSSQNSSKGNSSNNKDKEKGVFKAFISLLLCCAATTQKASSSNFRSLLSFFTAKPSSQHIARLPEARARFAIHCFFKVRSYTRAKATLLCCLVGFVPGPLGSLMGVLPYRLHGSITAVAAMAALSASPDLSEQSFLRPFGIATGQTLRLSSAYAPTFFEFDFSIPNSSPMASIACGQPPLHTTTHIIPFSPFTSQSSALRFYKAESTVSLGQIYWQRVIRPCRDTYHPTEKFSCTMYRPSPWLVLDSGSLNSSPSRSCRHLIWKYPPTTNRKHACIMGQHCMAADFPVPRFSNMFDFEKLYSLLYGVYENPSMGSTSLLHSWHNTVKNTDSDDGEKQLVKHKPSVAVVLLGWLGAEHRHLKKYADWYTSRGIHAVTFIVPIKDLLTLKVGDRAEKHVDVLTQNLVQWLKEDASENNEKIVIFHTFSNTGWLIYGTVLERLISQGDDLLERIKGCVVDSAPSARPDPHVWASGFSAALLKKGSVATQMLQPCGADDWNGVVSYPKPSFKETALLAMLENFFSVFLQIPYVNRRLNDVVSVLANKQPACPQLYIYSSADSVIPAKSVESFIEEQRKAGHMVKACNFQCSPHVDHFRTNPDKYSEQLTIFLKLCVPQWAAR